MNIADKEGKLKLDFYSDEEIHVLIKFSCLKAVKRFRLGVYVSTRQGMHIMSSIFTDEDSMLGYQNLKPGEYKWSCIIPSNLFGSNEYLFTIGMMAHTVHHINLPNLFLIKTKFLGYNKVLHLVNAPSPIKPKLKWKEF